jgi:cellulose synthase/poly-beta-1,6-N-acetylglucosamine synthase-like glycosyltransferase
MDIPSAICTVGLLAYLFVAIFWAIGAVRSLSSRRLAQPWQPMVSVIVAARNEEAQVGSCLRSILEQTYPSESYEIILVDDHSLDRTADIARSIAADSSPHLQVISAPPCPAGAGPKKNALRAGIEISAGQILLFTDADCTAGPNWIRSHVEAYHEGVGAVTGATLPESDPHHRALTSKLERLLVSYTSASAIGWGSAASVSGANFSYRREAYDEIGGIARPEVASGDDDLMAQEIVRRGWKMRFLHDEDALIRERRRVDGRRHLQAAARHQSTVVFYPLMWKLAYAFSIAAAALFLTSLALCPMYPRWALPALAVFALRLLIDGWTLRAFCHRLGQQVCLREIILAEIALPFYSILRPLPALVFTYDWRGRSHRRMASSRAEPTS